MTRWLIIIGAPLGCLAWCCGGYMLVIVVPMAIGAGLRRVYRAVRRCLP